MSRTDIPINKPLSDEDRAYLLMRGEDAKVQWYDTTYPAGAEDADEDVEDDEPGDGYDQWTVAQLSNRIRDLNADGAEISPAGTKKDDLIAALREYDALPDDDE